MWKAIKWIATSSNGNIIQLTHTHTQKWAQQFPKYAKHLNVFTNHVTLPILYDNRGHIKLKETGNPKLFICCLQAAG